MTKMKTTTIVSRVWFLVATALLAASCTVAGQADEDYQAVETPLRCDDPELRLAVVDGATLFVEDVCAGDRVSTRLELPRLDDTMQPVAIDLSPDGRHVVVTAWSNTFDAGQLWLYGPIVSLETTAGLPTHLTSIEFPSRVIDVTRDGEARLRAPEGVIGISIDGAARAIVDIPPSTDSHDVRFWPGEPGYVTWRHDWRRVELISMDTGELVDSWSAESIVTLAGRNPGARAQLSPVAVTRSGRVFLHWDTPSGDSGASGTVWAAGSLVVVVEPEPGGELSPMGEWWGVERGGEPTVLVPAADPEARITLQAWPSQSDVEPANDPRPGLYDPCVDRQQVGSCGPWGDDSTLTWSSDERRVVISFRGDDGAGQFVGGLQLHDLETGLVVAERVLAASEPYSVLTWDAVVFDAR